ncbi:MAG TPA: GGDEF domain-containing protein [Dehalococcoidia bacterium]|nr:GGDEF domain-containing protein [Dehalococcoidia bacterium]
MSFKETVVARRTAIALLDYWCLVLLIALPIPFPIDKEILLPAVVAGGLPVFAWASILLWRSGRASGQTLAYNDELTGIGNRRAFVARAKQLLKRRQIGSVALALFDVDGLKAINDGCGHQAGDELIFMVGRKLAASHTSVYRIGGDEFAVLIDRSAGESLNSILSHLEPIDHQFESCGHVHRICLSYGHASSHAGESMESMFARADARLRQCKRRLYSAGELPERRYGQGVEDAPTGSWAYMPLASLAEARRARASGDS